MPFDRARYPKDWDTISRQVREDAGQKCQRCGVANGIYIIRNGDKWREVSGMEIEAASLDGEKVTRVVLTVAHVGDDKHNKMDCTSLLALCQRCHLLEDLDDHVRNAAETRRRKRQERGQVPLFADVQTA